MRDSIYRVSLDVHDTASQVQLISLKGDTARHIEFTLTEDGKPYKLSEGDTATVAAKKPDGTTALNACEIYLETGIIKFDFTSAFVAANGLIECNLRVIGSDGHLLTSPRFTILVNEMAFDGTGVTGTDEWTLLSQKVTAATNATTAANNAATSATTAASAANTAAGSANSAASSATTAAGTANSAASSATAAAASANTAASTANGAASSADYSSDLATAAATSATNAATSANTAAALAQSRAQDAYRAYDSATAAATRASTASTGAEKVNISATRNAAQKKVTVTTTDRTGTETNVDLLDGAKGDKGDAGAYVNASTSANSFEALEEQTEWYVDNVEQERYVMIASLINAVSLQQATRLVIGIGDNVYYFQLASSYTERAINYLDYVSSEAQKKIHLGDDDTLEVIDDVFHLETSTAITAGSTDNTVSTSKAVYDFVSPIATRVSDNETAIAGKADAAHTHYQSDITGLQSALSGKAAKTHTHSMSDISSLSSTLSGKANTSHSHTTGDISGLSTALNGKANTSHTHSMSDISSLASTLNGKSNTGHTHTLASLYTDDTHNTVSNAEKASWNGKANTSAIPTTIAQLTDDATHRVVTDTEKASWNAKSTFSGDYNDLTNKPTIPDVSGKQDTLVSGTNIKTINGNSILGSGNIAIESGEGWTSAQITMLETIFSNLVYADNSTGQTVATNLIASLRGTSPTPPTPTTNYSISNALTNVTNSNSATSVTQNASYSATLTADDGYEINSVTITMGGVNVTDSVYSNGTISISAVTGNVTIIATARSTTSAIYRVQNQVCDGTQSAYNSNNNYLETSNKAFTLVADFIPNSPNSSAASSVAKMMKSSSPWPGVAITRNTGDNDYTIRWMSANKDITGSSYKDNRIKVVMTHEAGSNTANVYYKINDADVVSDTLSSSYTSISTPFVVANTSTGTQPFIGTINDVALYESVFTESQIASFFA